MNEPPPEGTYQAWPETPRYPLAFDVDPHTRGRNRLTVFFRFFLAIPHLIIVGGAGLDFSFNIGGDQQIDEPVIAAIAVVAALLSTGLLTIAVGLTTFISWFAIAGTHPRGLWKFALFYLRWKANVSAYLYLLRDEYPPFGEAPYPVLYEVDQPEHRIRWKVLIRLILIIPQAIVVALLQIAWFITVIIAWFAILFTGNYPDGLYRFGVGVLRWDTRVNAYFFLLRDEYPPFSLDP